MGTRGYLLRTGAFSPLRLTVQYHTAPDHRPCRQGAEAARGDPSSSGGLPYTGRRMLRTPKNLPLANLR
jgi:hypothetical protein